MLVRCERCGHNSVQNLNELRQLDRRVQTRDRTNPIVIFHLFCDGAVLVGCNFVEIRGPCPQGPLFTPVVELEGGSLPVANGDLRRSSKHGHVYRITK